MTFAFLSLVITSVVISLLSYFQKEINSDIYFIVALILGTISSLFLLLINFFEPVKIEILNNENNLLQQRIESLFTEKNELTLNESKLEKVIENTQSELKNNLHELIIEMYKKEKFNDNCRITIYKNVDNKLYLVERYSRNTIYQKIGRENISFTDSFVGCLQKSHSHNIIINLPDSYNENSPSKYIRNVKDFCNKKQVLVEENVIKNLAMKSTNYYLEKLYNKKEEVTGVLVVETTEDYDFNTIKGNLHEYAKFIQTQIEGVFQKYFVEGKRIESLEEKSKSNKGAKWGVN